ncbi:hypothetical protein N1851_007916 [Merluccius polli]|uniref:Uncharacterized protein n=1 Tax=Merluccius polli TaxID=89951 RepID=A0AA47N294_MERPO|nr:hypothetical protein N1851_032081 [Merluccius polli]KAK0150972.1 hypothetical protein N1851_007916 [Merluccius polli]
MLVFVHSLREASFSMYLNALTELAKWFHAMDHTHYARWIPVHLRDMAELPRKHPNIAQEFHAGNFTVQKSMRVFSSIAIDQAHEQMNACIKGDGGAVGLTDNPSAFLRWMVAGPEVARLIQEFEDVLPSAEERMTLHIMTKQIVSRPHSSGMLGLLLVSWKTLGTPLKRKVRT